MYNCSQVMHQRRAVARNLHASTARRPQTQKTPHATHRVHNIKLHLPRIDFTLAYKALPCALFPPTATNPLMFNCLRACLHASHHFFNALCANFFLLAADAALLTTFPLLFLVNVAFVKPPDVFSFLPLKTRALAPLPLATMLTFFTFFIAFIDFIEAAFIAFMPVFIAGLRAAFIAFIAFAMTSEPPC